MVTQIKPIYDKEDLLKWYEFKTAPFYCKEDSKTVLKELFAKYHVSRYNHISTLEDPIGVFNTNSKKYPPLYYRGLIIEPLITSAPEVNASWKDFDYTLPNKTITDYVPVMNDLIKNYLINTTIVRQSKYLFSSKAHGVRIPRLKLPDVIKFTSYLDTRKNNSKENKELQLEDILTYGKVALGDSFNIDDINTLILKMEKDFRWIRS